MRALIITLTLTFLSFVTACNTVGGFGKDVQKGGENLEESADKHK